MYDNGELIGEKVGEKIKKNNQINVKNMATSTLPIGHQAPESVSR